MQNCELFPKHTALAKSTDGNMPGCALNLTAIKIIKNNILLDVLITKLYIIGKGHEASSPTQAVPGKVLKRRKV